MSVLTIAKMANAGYRFDFLLALMAEGLTDVRGPETGVGTDFRPGDPEFIEVIQSIGRLIDKGQLKVGNLQLERSLLDITTSAKRLRSITSLPPSPLAAVWVDFEATMAERPTISPISTIIQPCGLIRMREHRVMVSA
jgi:hypothetical protein